MNMNKIFIETDYLLDDVHTFIQDIKNNYNLKKISIENIKIIDEYIEVSTKQLISLDTIITDDITIKIKRKNYIIATQNYINQLEDLKDGTDRINMLSYQSNRESYLPENRHSDYALSPAFNTNT